MTFHLTPAMRYLHFACPSLPPAELAQVYALLKQLRVTQPFSLEKLEVEEDQFFAILLSLARQYPGCLESLLTAGYNAVARLVGTGVEQPSKWSWWVREEITVASEK